MSIKETLQEALETPVYELVTIAAGLLEASREVGENEAGETTTLLDFIERLDTLTSEAEELLTAS